MDFNRAKIVDENFTYRVLAQDFPVAHSSTTPQAAGLDKQAFLELFASQMASRHLDLLARILREQQQGFYTIGSAGHEGNAAIAKAFRKTDMSFLHYRSGAFMIERARYEPQIDILFDQVLSLVASCDDPISGGRHKVFGSLPLYVPPQTSTIASHLPKAIGCALSLTLAKTVKLSASQTKLPINSVVLCSFGDASVNHSTAQGAFNAALWIQAAGLPLPLLWICEDNHIGISVATPDNWIKSMMQNRAGMHYIACDGRNLADVYLAAKKAEVFTRVKRQVTFLHLKTVRLLGHAGSDIESQYHTLAEIEQAENDDPLLHSARIIIDHKWLTPQAVVSHYENIRQKLLNAADRAMKHPKLSNQRAIMASIVPPVRECKVAVNEEKNVGSLNMAQAINHALAEILALYPQALVFGEDVGKKGGVYRVTADLQKRFGKARVFDTLLDEQTILGCAIGLAHNGFIPIPEIQFLAYTHNAIDQIRGEAATLSFFSNGQYTNPMVIRIAGLAYQKGFGGHFHNDNAIGFLREIPGVIIACPSQAMDAALLLKECFRLAYQEQRVVIFLEPIALYRLRDYHNKGDNLALSDYPLSSEKVRIGEIGIEGEHQSTVSILSYGNGMVLARQAAYRLKKQYQIAVKLIDCRWLSPLPINAIQAALKDQKHVVIVDECRQTGSLSEQLVTWMVENMATLPVIRRICAADCFIPLGNASENILPSCEDIITCVLELYSIKRSR